MAPAAKKGKGSSEKLSKLCAKSWWKLKESDREEHNEVMKIQLLSPFLYKKVYQDEIWIDWAKSAKLLNEGRTSKLDVLSDEELMNVDLMELAIIKLQQKILLDFNGNASTCGALDGLIKSVEACQDKKQLPIALSKISGKDWFCYVKSQVRDLVAISLFDRCDAAILLVAWQVSFYIKTIHKGEKMLQTFLDYSTLDKDLDIDKTKGNEFFKTGEYSKAIGKYTSILCAKPYFHIVYGNRAICYIKKHQYRAALADGRRCITLNPKWHKGQQRYAQALFELGYSDAALKVVSNAIKICEDKKFLTTYMDEIKIKVASDNTMTKITNGILKGVKERTGQDFGGDSSSNEGDSEDVPDLVSDSDSNDEEESTPSSKAKNKKDMSKKKNAEDNVPAYIVGSLLHNQSKREALAKRRQKERVKREEEEEKAKKDKQRNKLNNFTKQASLALLGDEEYKNYNPMNEYKKSKNMILAEPEILSKKELVILYYAHACSFLESKKETYIIKSIEMFTEITVKFKDVIFALPYLGIGKAHFKQNNFSKMKKPLNKALYVVSQTGCLRNCSWPGIEQVIDETSPGRLEVVVADLLKNVDNPPASAAQCLYKDCPDDRTVIYFTDLDFTGFVRLLCTEECTLEFHSACWLKVKQGFSTDKGFLKTPCITNDCSGRVNRIQIYNSRDGKPSQVYNIEIDGITKGKKREALDVARDENKENNGVPTKAKKNKKKKTKTAVTPNLPSDTKYQKYRTSLNADFDFDEFNDIVEAPHQTAFEIYDFVEKLLSNKSEPFVDVTNCVDMMMHYANMSKAVKRFIDEVGGLRTLLSKCDVFSFDGRQLNILYLTAHKLKYEKYKQTHKDNELLHPPTPEDEDEEKTFEQIFRKHPNVTYKASKNSVKNQTDISKTIYSVNRTTDNETFETLSNFSVVTINSTKEKSIKTSKVLRDLLHESSRRNTGKKKRCAECGVVVINNILCKCVCAQTYDQIYVPEDDMGGVYTLSRPPHNRCHDDDNDERPKIEDITDDDIKTTDNSDRCVVNVGIQAGTQAGTSMEDRKRNENLIETNRKLFTEVKNLRAANEKLSEDLKKEKHKHTMSAEQHRNEKSDYKKEKEKWKKELNKMRQTHENDMKRLQSEKKEVMTILAEHAQEKELINAKEKEFDSLNMKKVNELDELRREKENIRHEYEQQKRDHEDIVRELTQSINEQSKRAEKVEVALLEAKKDTVVIKYQQQAHTIQNTINQMKYLTHLPEIQVVQQVWQDYKIDYQAAYEKMQEEFANLIETVMNGHPLESLPPARYAVPPPYPNCPVPTKPQMMMNSQMPQTLPPRPILHSQSTIEHLHTNSLLPQHSHPLQHSQPPQHSQPLQHSQPPRHSQPSQQSQPPKYPQPPHALQPPQVRAMSSTSHPSTTQHRQNNSTNNIPFTPSTVTSDNAENNVIASKHNPSQTANSDNQSAKTTEQPTVTLPSSNQPVQASSHHISNAPSYSHLRKLPSNHSDSEDSECSSRGSSEEPKYGKVDEPRHGKMDEKVLMRLGSIFPTAPRDELLSYFNEYRKQGPLSGQRFEDIIANVEKNIRRNKQHLQQQQQQQQQQQMRTDYVNKQVNKSSVETKLKRVPRVQGPGAIDSNATKRTRANQVQGKTTLTPGYTTGYSTSLLGNSVTPTRKKHNIFGQEEPCVICYEDMTAETALLLHCGHTFHRNCISCWLKEQRTCPVCRVLALLPDEYPALSAK